MMRKNESSPVSSPLGDSRSCRCCRFIAGTNLASVAPGMPRVTSITLGGLNCPQVQRWIPAQVPSSARHRANHSKHHTGIQVRCGLIDGNHCHAPPINMSTRFASTVPLVSRMTCSSIVANCEEGGVGRSRSYAACWMCWLLAAFAGPGHGKEILQQQPRADDFSWREAIRIHPPLEEGGTGVFLPLWLRSKLGPGRPCKASRWPEEAT